MFLYTCCFSIYSPSTSTVLRQCETRACMPSLYQLVSCSRSHVLTATITLWSSSNLVQCSVSFSGPKRWKSDGARSGLYGGWGSTVQPNFQLQLVVCNVYHTQTPFSQTTTAALSVGRPCTYTHVRNKHQCCYLWIFTLLSLFWNENKNVGHYFLSNLLMFGLKIMDFLIICWKEQTSCTTFLINLFQLYSPLQVYNKQFITTRSLHWTSNIKFFMLKLYKNYVNYLYIQCQKYKWFMYLKVGIYKMLHQNFD